MIAFKASARQWLFALGFGFVIPGYFSFERYQNSHPDGDLVEHAAILHVKKDRGRNFFTFSTANGDVKCNIERCHQIGLTSFDKKNLKIYTDKRGVVFSIRDNDRFLLTKEDSAKYVKRDGAEALIYSSIGIALMVGSFFFRRK